MLHVRKSEAASNQVREDNFGSFGLHSVASQDRMSPESDQWRNQIKGTYASIWRDNTK